MPLPSPNLDDRRFPDLLAEAVRRLDQSCPAWTDRSPGDPGMALLDVFAHLTEVLLYRLNRVPDKAYIEFLRLIGAQLHPPAAATVTLRFTRTGPGGGVINIPRGTAVQASGGTDGPPPVFLTTAVTTLGPEVASAEVRALHGTWIEGELLGLGTGRPGLSLTAAYPPFIAPTGDDIDLIVGVELAPGERDQRTPALRFEGRDFRLWHQVPAFTDLGDDPHAVMVDRAAGSLLFAPALMDARSGRSEALAAVPPLGRQIRVWYVRGGGPAGNVPAGILTTLVQTIPGVAVTNPSAAAGGREAEDLEHALRRGPSEFQSLHRAVTARDFEALALRASGGVARAVAVTAAERWAHAERGTVEIILVPTLPPGQEATAVALRAQQTEVVRCAVSEACDLRRPLGTRCTVGWAPFKTVSVQARVVIHREENPEAVRERVLSRLRNAISPLPSVPFPSGWPFGRALRASHIYDIILGEPGVNYVDQVRLYQDAVPEAAVRHVAADHFQRRTWFAAAATGVFRSTNDVDGWEPISNLPGAREICPSPMRSGLLAVVVDDRVMDDTEGSAIHVSDDGGESWRLLARTAFTITGTAWLSRGTIPVLLLATAAGLFELPLIAGAVPTPVAVDEAVATHGCYAVVVADDGRGGRVTAVAARRQAGVWISWSGGPFHKSGLIEKDIRSLCVQVDGPRRFLWAGAAAPGDHEGRGCLRLELRGEASDEQWQPAARAWSGGSVRCLTSDGTRIFAGTHRAGVMVYDTSARDPQWRSALRAASGLPIRRDEREGLLPVDSVATVPGGALILVGGGEGVWRSLDGVHWQVAASRQAIDRLTLPETWLFCSGDHDVQVVSDGNGKDDDAPR